LKLKEEELHKLKEVEKSLKAREDDVQRLKQQNEDLKSTIQKQHQARFVTFEAEKKILFKKIEELEAQRAQLKK